MVNAAAALRKDELALHCRRKTRGAKQTLKVLEDLIISMIRKQVLATMMAIAGTLTVTAVCRGATVDKCTVIGLVNCRTVKASTGWLKRFLLRHGMSSISLQGEALSADVSSVGDFRKELAEFF